MRLISIRKGRTQVVGKKKKTVSWKEERGKAEARSGEHFYWAL